MFVLMCGIFTTQLSSAETSVNTTRSLPLLLSLPKAYEIKHGHNPSKGLCSPCTVEHTAVFLTCNNAGMNVSNSSRYYIYDSEFDLQSQALHVNSDTAATLRSYFHQNLPWAMQYRSAVDDVLRNTSVQSEFAEVP